MAKVDDEYSLNSEHLDDMNVESIHNDNVDSNEVTVGGRQERHSSKRVYLFLCLVAAVAGLGTYVYMKREAKVWVHDEFEEFAEVVLASSRSRLIKADLALLSLCDTITSYALDDHRQEDADGTAAAIWPNVTLSNFDVRVATIKQLMGAQVIAFAPLVELAKKAVNETSDRTSTVFDYRLPIGQLDPAPVNPGDSPLYMDLLSLLPEFRQIMEEVIEQRHSVLSPVLKDHRVLTSYDKVTGPRKNKALIEEDEDEAHASHSAEHDVPTDNDDDLPRSIIVAPVHETFEPDAELVGVVVGVISWIDFFADMLEDEAEGLIIDLEDSCKGTKDYFRITESGTTWVGHFEADPRYVDASERIRFGLNIHGSEDDEDDGEVEEDDRRRLGPDDVNKCGSDLVVLMSHSFTDNWENNKIWSYPAIIVSIFIFIGLVFVFDDIAVRQRQARIVKAATRNERLVSTLFPEDVRKRLIEEDEARQAAKQKKGKSIISQQFAAFAGSDDNENPVAPSKAIAQLFPDATIMCFTSWSSTREPTDVFTLLETLYGAFDKIASRLGVFKVETIGDCYLAVCGLPDPNPDHASVMAQFAWECLHTMRRLVRELEGRLGPDTGYLSMRTGLHSGPVTAGVLRGVRARFQLFGDTVNTAQRMESTGMALKVQVSAETARLLVASGKDGWIKKREESVVAKGKGEMETYWLDLGKPKPSSSTSSTVSASAYRTVEDVGPAGPMRDVEHKSSVGTAGGGEKGDRSVDFRVEI